MSTYTQMPVAIYARVSSEGQTQGASLNTQLRRCTEVVRDLRLGRIVSSIAATESARYYRCQHVLRELLESRLLQNGGYVIINEPTRLSRDDATGFNELLNYATERGIVFVTRSDDTGKDSPRVYDTPESLDALREAIVRARRESDRIGARIRQNIEERLTRGRELGLDVTPNSRVGFGWRTERNEEHNLFVRYPEVGERAILRAIRLLGTKFARCSDITAALQRLSGNTEKKFTYTQEIEYTDRDGKPTGEKKINMFVDDMRLPRRLPHEVIAEEMNDWGILRRGRPWTASSVSAALRLEFPVSGTGVGTGVSLAFVPDSDDEDGGAGADPMCRSCNRTNPKGSNFCGGCGSRI